MKTDNLFILAGKSFLRLLLNHVMCLVVAVSIVLLLRNKTGVLIAQFFNLGIILFLPYLAMWTIGDSERNMANFGHIRADKFRGFRAGIIACIPFIAVSVLVLLAKGGVVPSSFLAYYRMIMSPFMPFNQMILPTTLTLAEQSRTAVMISASTCLIEPVVLGLGYYMGFERVSFTDQFIFPNGKKAKKN